MKWLRGVLIFGTFAVLYVMEDRRPLRLQKQSKLNETARNLAIASFAGLITVLIEKPITDKLTKFVEKENFGLLNIIRLPSRLKTILSLVLLDYTLYFWHVLTHKLPFLWNFHKIHHADLDLSSSTAIRFHFGEITISVLFRAGQILLLGISQKDLETWQTLVLLSILFHHSNLKLPRNLEQKLGAIIMTPRLHGIHHSVEEAEMNSNWSSGLSFWDKLHGTFRSDVPQSKILIGVKEFPEPDDVQLQLMLFEPFGMKSDYAQLTAEP